MKIKHLIYVTQLILIHPQQSSDLLLNISRVYIDPPNPSPLPTPPGDQVVSEVSQEVLFHPSDVVQVSAVPLLRPVVHLSAVLRQGVPLQGAGAAHRLRRPQEDAGQETTASRRGTVVVYPLVLNM